jgi:hypothetical protein
MVQTLQQQQYFRAQPFGRTYNPLRQVPGEHATSGVSKAEDMASSAIYVSKQLQQRATTSNEDIRAAIARHHASEVVGAVDAFCMRQNLDEWTRCSSA